VGSREYFDEVEARKYFVIPEYKPYQYRKTRLFRWMPGLLFRLLETGCRWHPCVTAQKADRDPGE
jgi:hypothetical protein